MGTDRAPYDNNEVRLALKFAFDRELVLRTVLKGYGNLGNDHPISPANRYFDHDLPQRKYEYYNAAHAFCFIGPVTPPGEADPEKTKGFANCLNRVSK